MIRPTLYAGVLLILLGVGSYFGTGRASFTALIPAIIGALFAILAMWGQQQSRRKAAMHVVMVLALLGVLGSSRGLAPFAQMLSGGEVERPVAVVAQVVTSVVCLALLLAGIKSFVDARRKG